MTSRLLIVGLGRNRAIRDAQPVSLVRQDVGVEFVSFLKTSDCPSSSWRTLSTCLSEVCEAESFILLRPWGGDGGVMAVAKACALFNVTPRNLLVVHSELDRNVGSYSFSSKGTSINPELISIQKAIGTPPAVGTCSSGRNDGARISGDDATIIRFMKLGIGIGRPAMGGSAALYVKSRTSPKECGLLWDSVFPKCREQLYRDFLPSKKCSMGILPPVTNFAAEKPSSRPPLSNAAARRFGFNMLKHVR
eukprot:GHVS01100411.1.p1 GENE.GHVS01100411.1~~GHVS01100411.1.p1  ORF type:complete len:249 (+),score=27.86 GHVS01100411.1:325-1071(+)